MDTVVAQEEDILFEAAKKLADQNIDPQEKVAVGPILEELWSKTVQQMSIATGLTGGPDVAGVQAVDLDSDTESSLSEEDEEGSAEDE